MVQLRDFTTQSIEHIINHLNDLKITYHINDLIISYEYFLVEQGIVKLEIEKRLLDYEVIIKIKENNISFIFKNKVIHNFQVN